MRNIILVVIMIGLSACTEKPTQKACLISDADAYISNSFREAGMNGPNRAGIDAFNQKIHVSGFNNRRKSEFGFRYKGKGQLTEKVKCQSEKLACEDPQAKHCQRFKCEAIFPAGFEINIIDTPRREFYRTVEPTYMLWDGDVLKCQSK